ncbi:glucose-1-phosphate thymidylyltransferase [Streptomyces sp. P38-E01]|uniref:Glucose-1-phosphate thymidylyltransferase n=1 Tax=Streptomyces tardus TaxID=2780544 RepID=A0A949JHR4_9ACTN|nr:glucose-1-phosphate thymidylyltransferase [Streptomyces tardus]MBU7598814.1 glucose-1-phosphate thymidylyltransferase [Streptomyces tardus]
MKALVLAGGLGTRLRPFTETMPKQLMPIANQPVLEHVLTNIRALGVREICVVVGEWGPAIEARLGDGSRFGARITYLRQEQPLGLAHCVALARPFLGDDDFVMYLGDNVVESGVAELAEDFRNHRSDAHLAVARVTDPRAFGVAELDTEGRVLRLVEKPSRPRSDLALIGVYFFGPAIHRAVAAIRPSARGELEITDAVQRLVEGGARVTAGEYDGYWKDTGSVADLLDCNRRLLDALEGDVGIGTDGRSSLNGPVRLGPGATVVRSVINGPVVVGAGSLIEDCHIGPGTSIGSGCVLRGAELRNSIVLDGARVTGRSGGSGSLISDTAEVHLDTPPDAPPGAPGGQPNALAREVAP